MRLLVSYSGALGGGERVLLTIAPSLGDDCVLACPAGPLATQAGTRGLRVFPLPERSLDLRGGGARGRAAAIAHLLSHAAEIDALTSALAPELVVAWGMRSMLAAWIAHAQRRAPVVFQHNDLLPRGATGLIVRHAARRGATRVIALSNAIAADLRGPASRVEVIHPGVDLDHWAEDLGPPAEPPEAVLLGAIVNWKRPDIALEAVAHARSRRPDLGIRLRIVGAPIDEAGDELLRTLRARASEGDLADAVAFCGPVSDPRAELARATCLLHCAPREPFGLVMVEALAAGRPVVAPDGGGAPEIVDGSCGALYAPGDPAGAASALLSVLDRPDRGASLGAAGRMRAAERFDGAAAARSWGRAAERVTRRRPRSVHTAHGRLALVTVTHESSTDLAALLRSVARHLPGARVVVVDCASRDDSVQVARRPRPAIQVDVIALEENVGFGTACNIGVRAVDEPVTALLNPDVELLDDSLLGLVDEALRDEEPGRRLLAPLVIRPDGRRQDSVHPHPLSRSALAHAVIPPGAVIGRVAYTIAPWRSPAPRRVGWAVGCALVARTSLLSELGPFDESIFLYSEDLDLGLRAAETGIETWFWPTARVLHHGGHSTLPAFGGEPFERLARARHGAIKKTLGARAAFADDGIQGITFASRMAIKRIAGIPAQRERAQLRALALRRRQGAGPTCGRDQ